MNADLDPYATRRSLASNRKRSAIWWKVSTSTSSTSTSVCRVKRTNSILEAPLAPFVSYVIYKKTYLRRYLQEDLLAPIQVTVLSMWWCCASISSLVPSHFRDCPNVLLSSGLVLSAKASKPTINCTMLTPVVHTLGDESACIAYVLLLQFIDR